MKGGIGFWGQALTFLELAAKKGPTQYFPNDLYKLLISWPILMGFNLNSWILGFFNELNLTVYLDVAF